MNRRPKSNNDWRAILGVQARIATLFFPVVAALIVLIAVTGTARHTAPDGIDSTTTSSVR